MLRLREARIAHGALGGDTIIVSDRGICVRDFRRASASAPAGRLDGDLAAALGAMAVRAGAERTAAAAARVLEADTARAALVHLQRSALDPVTVAGLQHQKDLLPRLRAAVAAGAGIEVPKLAEAKRVSWANLLFAVGSLIGIWAIIGILSDAGDSLDAIKGASWGWVALTFVFAQLPVVAEGWRFSAPPSARSRSAGASRWRPRTSSPRWSAATRRLRAPGEVFPAPGVRRRGRGQRRRHRDHGELDRQDPAVPRRYPVRRRKLPRPVGLRRGPGRGLDHPRGHPRGGDRRRADRPGAQLRRLVSRKIRPHLLNIWANVKTIATEPHKIVYVVAGSTLAELLVILALGASLHAVGQHVSIATLITVNTLASILGGAVPVPGGLGVVEAGLIAGLTSAGFPQDQAVAAVLIQRFFTSYLPPVWGWATLAWMRRREYV